MMKSLSRNRFCGDKISFPPPRKSFSPFVSNRVLNPRNDFLRDSERERERDEKQERKIRQSGSLEHFNIPHQTWITKIPPILPYSNNDIHSREK